MEDYEPPKIVPVMNLNDKLVEVLVPTDAAPAAPRNCGACTYSGIEPDDMDLTCGHPGAGTFGRHVRREPPDFEWCRGYGSFVQHPLRNPDGSLKPTSLVR